MRDHTLSISLYCVCEKSWERERESICEKCEDRERQSGPERRVKDKWWDLRERMEGNIRNKDKESERLWERLREAVECKQNNISRFIPCPHLTLPDTNTFIHMQSDTAAHIPTHSHKHTKPDDTHDMFRSEREFTITN